MHSFFRRSRLVASIFALATVVSGCASLPSLDGRSSSIAITDTGDTRLGRTIDPRTAANPGRSGIHPLEEPHEAFAARVALARVAERSLDVQYYIWHGDTTGYLLLEELWRAAERGVRVRLLLDDNGIGGLDATVAAMDSHENIEVRLFNPFVNRTSRALGYLTDFSRLNRRMHNKSFTADARAAIVGGRNIGDEYFGAGQRISFADLDVVATGPAAAEVVAVFDTYWNSPSAYPAKSIVAAPTNSSVQALLQKFAAVGAAAAAVTYVSAVRNTGLVADLRAGTVQFEWAPVTLVYDEPTKIQGKAQRSDLLLTRLLEAFGTTEREVDIISPYFVPGEKGTASLCSLRERGIRVRVLTNSLAATDVGAVHAAYGKRRRALLECGTSLYEMRPDAGTAATDGDPGSKKKMLGGSSTASLHAKSFAMDRNRVFVGSFNLDPRSAELNTEMGFVIASPVLASALSDGLDRQIARQAYEVVLASQGGGLEWVERTPAGEMRHTKEPRTSIFKRATVRFLSWLPIDWLM